MALKIAMFSDFICPFCYIGFEVMRQLKPEFDFELEWRGFQIHPDWPAEGIGPERAMPGGNADSRKATWQRITEMATSVGLEMKPPSLMTNSHSALMVAEYARDAGKSMEFDERVYRAYFLDNVNIGDPAAVLALAKEAGLDEAAAVEAIKSPKYQMKLKNNALAANQRGVDGVPTFFIGEYALRGAQSPDTMRKVLKRAGEIFGD
ncbi:MAG TPA: DsbA family oxidoreductase [Candidatus Binataceae bacterium]|nr:DsbA family oxidoreductase [Candidatus Binataceae bacterium]